MKKTAILFMAIISVLSISCNKEYRFYGFDITETITVPVTAGTIDFYNEQTVDLKYKEILAEKGTASNLVESITLEEVSVNETDYETFSSAHFRISAEGKEALLVAEDSDSTYYSFNTGGFVYKMPGIEESVKEYVEKSKLTFYTYGSLLSTSQADKSLNFTFRFRVLTYIK